MNQSIFEIIEERTKGELLQALEDIRPDYVVPVMKKGCKLLRHILSSQRNFSYQIRYKDFFDNTKVDVRGKTILIIDDATKFTSMLYKYRSYFEDKMANKVYTYSLVGQELLNTGKRKQYDRFAKILKFLPESTYQEYILQESFTLSSENCFFDIDHLVFTGSINSDRYTQLLLNFYRIGRLEYVNDIYTPEHLEKTVIYDIGFKDAQFLFPECVTQGQFQEIRFVYNKQSEELTISPISYPVWNSKIEANHEEMFSKVPFALPYVTEDRMTDSAKYFDITYAFHLSLYKYFFDSFSDFEELKGFRYIKSDLVAFVGNREADLVEESLYDYLKSDVNPVLRDDRISTYITSTGDKPFLTVKKIMDELRGEYERRTSENRTLIDVRYFLSYEELFSRYRGTSKLIKWINILCDRGVLVTRNYQENGIYYRACRSGEADYYHTEEKTSILLPIIINTCGSSHIIEEHQIYQITATYFNKVLANLVIDYPGNRYDFHCISTEPYYYGPYAYIKDKMCDQGRTPIHRISQISKYCEFDKDGKKFYSASMRKGKLKDDVGRLFGKNDAVPYTEITAYFGLLKIIREKRNDKELNRLAICRNEQIYYKHLFFNLWSAYKNIMPLVENSLICGGKGQREKLDEASIHIKSAKEKLTYDQKQVKDFVREIDVDTVYEKAREQIVDSFIDYSKDFLEKTKPALQEVYNLECVFVYCSKYFLTFEKKYWNRVKRVIEEGSIEVNWDREWIKRINSYQTMPWTNEEYEEILRIWMEEVRVNIYSRLKERIEELKQPKEPMGSNIIKAINGVKRELHQGKWSKMLFMFYSFSEFRNRDVNVDEDVVLSIQRHIANTIKDKKIEVLFGVTGDEEYGLLLIEDYAEAVEFSTELIQWVKRKGQIDFRFGCSVFDHDKREDLDVSIRSRILKAQECAMERKKESHLIIDKCTYYDLEKNDGELASRFIRVGAESEEYYENQEIHNMTSEFVYAKQYDEEIKIGIITVLNEEYNAVEAMMTHTRNVLFHGRGAGNRFLIGEIKAFGGGTNKVVLAQTLGDNNNRAAIRAEKMMSRYPNIEVIFMVGIAGGTPLMPDDPEFYNESAVAEKHVRLGDIVVANSIIQYDYIKEKISETTYKGRSTLPSAEYLEIVQQLNRQIKANDNNTIWKKYIDEVTRDGLNDYCRPDAVTDILHDVNGEEINHPVDPSRITGFPRVFVGKIASSNTVLKNPKKRSQLKKEQGVLGIEMETSGIADSTWEAAIGYFAVRGICDYCDDFKNDVWHKYAALAAAAYVRAIIEQLPQK